MSGAANGDFLKVDDLNLRRNSFTFSCWIKPNGIQEDYSGIFSTQDDNTSLILNFLNGDNTIGFHPTWWWSSGLRATPDEWSHVALVSNGSQVKIYVNGEESVNNTTLSSQVVSKIDLGRYGRGYSSRYTNLEMDEVSIWNRPLSIDEIRQWRHLTKTDITDPIFTGLVAYYQFNESNGNISINKTSNTNYASYFGVSASNHIASNAPVFNGKSEKININSAGTKDFSTTGLSMNFANGMYPNGDVWVSTGTIDPDVLPDALQYFNSYAIINNYGQNQTFTSLESMTFTGNSEYYISSANDYNLYKRNSNDFGDSWGSILDTGDAITGTGGANTLISFSTGLMVSSFSQFVLSNNDSSLSVNEELAIKNPIIYPNPLTKDSNLSITIPSGWEDSTLIVYNLLGQKISQASLIKGENILKLNTDSGIYNIVIFNSKHKLTKKLILN